MTRRFSDKERIQILCRMAAKNRREGAKVMRIEVFLPEFCSVRRAFDNALRAEKKGQKPAPTKGGGK